MRNVLIGRIVLNDDGYELSKEHPSTSNEWSEWELSQIKKLLDSGLDELRADIAIETYFVIMK